MTGFELRTSGNGSDRSTNWATTTALQFLIIYSSHSWGLGRQIMGLVYENQCDQIWRNSATLKRLQILCIFPKSLSSIWQNFELILEKFVCYWANLFFFVNGQLLINNLVTLSQWTFRIKSVFTMRGPKFTASTLSWKCLHTNPHWARPFH